MLTIIFLIIILNMTRINCAEFTDKEKVALEKFRPLVQDVLSQDYMSEDDYLIRFLRAKDLDLDDSVEFIQDAMKWRKENNIDTILNETFAELPKVWPMDIQGVDKEGSPVLSLNSGRWDIRKYAISGQKDRATRYWDFIMEKVEQEIRDKNVTKAVAIMNVDGFNVRQHGCFSCVPTYLEWQSHYEKYHPGLLKFLIMINAPKIFNPIMYILKSFMSTSTLDIAWAFGPDKTEWAPFLLNIIPEDQLSVQFGGTRKP